jgi:amidase
MDKLKLDAVLFPTVADVRAGRCRVQSGLRRFAWSNGVWVANGNLAISPSRCADRDRADGGDRPDIGMPVGLTFAGPRL